MTHGIATGLWRLRGLRGFATRLGLMALLVVGVAACSSDGGFNPWVARGDACVRESSEGPTRRVTNYTDNELCGRTVKHRSKDYLRVEQPQSK